MLDGVAVSDTDRRLRVASRRLLATPSKGRSRTSATRTASVTPPRNNGIGDIKSCAELRQEILRVGPVVQAAILDECG